MKWVVDASVLAASIATPDQEPHAVPAASVVERLRAAGRLQAPALVRWELGNALHGRKRASFANTRDRRSQVLIRLLDGVELLPTEASDLENTGAIAEATGLSFYDAAYLEAAARSDRRGLLTLDARLHASAQKILGMRRALFGDRIVDAFEA